MTAPFLADSMYETGPNFFFLQVCKLHVCYFMSLLNNGLGHMDLRTWVFRLLLSTFFNKVTLKSLVL